MDATTAATMTMTAIAAKGSAINIPKKPAMNKNPVAHIQTPA
jgi:hypothetical protein